jgi:hypothetical protein
VKNSFSFYSQDLQRDEHLRKIPLKTTNGIYWLLGEDLIHLKNTVVNPGHRACFGEPVEFFP